MEFTALKNELIAKGIFKYEGGTRDMKSIEGVNHQLRGLFIDNVYPYSEETKGSLFFLIGGITDNSVGYFYIKDERNVPEMSPSHFIMIRSLGDGWYLYKTT